MTNTPPAAEKAPRPLAFYAVPSNAPSSRCKCGKTQYWIMTQRGKRMPVDCDVEGGRRPVRGDSMALPNPVDGEAGRGVSHFATCPNADGFRRGHTR